MAQFFFRFLKDVDFLILFSFSLSKKLTTKKNKKKEECLDLFVLADDYLLPATSNKDLFYRFYIFLCLHLLVATNTTLHKNVKIPK